MKWEIGRGLALVPGENRFHIVRDEEQAKDNQILVLLLSAPMMAGQ